MMWWMKAWNVLARNLSDSNQLIKMIMVGIPFYICYGSIIKG